MKPTPLEILNAELVTLHQEREAAVASIRAGKKRVRRLDIQISTLQKVLDRMGNPLSQSATADSEAHTGSQNGAPAQELQATPAVISFLRRHPASRPGEVVNALKDRIATVSSRPDRVLYNTIFHLQGRGIIVRGGKDNKELSLSKEYIESSDEEGEK